LYNFHRNFRSIQRESFQSFLQKFRRKFRSLQRARKILTFKSVQRVWRGHHKSSQFFAHRCGARREYIFQSGVAKRHHLGVTFRGKIFEIVVRVEIIPDAIFRYCTLGNNNNFQRFFVRLTSVLSFFCNFAACIKEDKHKQRYIFVVSLFYGRAANIGFCAAKLCTNAIVAQPQQKNRPHKCTLIQLYFRFFLLRKTNDLIFNLQRCRNSLFTLAFLCHL
jgi:hypothetical protein